MGLLRRCPVVLALLLACARPPALVEDARKLALARALPHELAASVEHEKTAVLAFTDEESKAFADRSADASRRVDAMVDELARLVTPAQRPALERFAAAWDQVKAIDARILPLAVANTNLKAARLSFEDAQRTLDALLGQLAAMEQATSDVAELRRIAHTAVAVLRIQSLHMQHNVEQSAEGMDALEAVVARHRADVDAFFAAPPRAGVSPERAEAARAWRQYVALTEEILRLSRLNTNVESFELSVRRKPPLSAAADRSLGELVEALTEHARPTR